MSYEDFHAKFRGRLLLHIAEAWAARNEGRGKLGMLIEEHMLGVKALTREMYDALVKSPDQASSVNGEAQHQRR